MKVRLNEWIGPCEHPILYRLAAQSLGITHDTLKVWGDKLGFPAHYRNIPFTDRPWLHYRVRVIFPSELLVLRVRKYPEFDTVVEIPDGLYGRGGLAPGAVAHRGGLHGGEAGGPRGLVDGEDLPDVGGDGDAVLRASGDGDGRTDDPSAPSPAGSGADVDGGVGPEGPACEANRDGGASVGVAGVDDAGRDPAPD